MTTVTIAEVDESRVKPEGAGWAKRSQNYDGPWPLYVGSTYDVEINSWKGTRGDTLWFLNKATPVGDGHAPPPAPSALPPHPDDMPRAPTVTPSLPPVDPTRASIERQVALKAAVEIWSGSPDVSAANVTGYADSFYVWLRNEAAPDGDPGPQQ